MAIQSDPEFAPTQIARAVFPTAFRGYDQDAVRRYLSRLAAALEHQQEYAGLGELEARTPAHERVDELETELEELRDEIRDLELELVQRSVDGDPTPGAHNAAGLTGQGQAPFDEHRAIELLGQETARVLESARSAAADILKRAETQAATLKAQAKTELADARRRAEELVAEKRSQTDELVTRLAGEAEATAERITREAEEHRLAVLDESSKILDEAETRSTAEQAAAEQRAKQIVADAETLRQQVISELVSERRQAKQDMDAMIAARDRLAMSLAVARTELDEVADALVDVSTVPADRPVDRTGAAEAADAAARHASEVDELIGALEATAGKDGPTVAQPSPGSEIQGSGDGSEAAGGGPAGGPGAASPTGEPAGKAGTRAAGAERRPAPPRTPRRSSKPEVHVSATIEADRAAAADGEAAAAGTVDGAADDGDDIEIIDLDDVVGRSVEDLIDSHPGLDINEPPADGERLSLIEGFTTIELHDTDPIDSEPAAARSGRRSGGGGRPDGESNVEVLHSVVINEPQIPEEVITTVSSRTAATQPDRTRGDLVIDEPFTGRLPREFAARDLALNRSGPNFQRQLRRALNDDQSDVLDRLRAGRGAIKVDELPAFGDQIDRYVAPLRRGLAEIAQAGAKAGGQTDLSQSALDNLVRQLAKYIVDKVRNPTMELIGETTDQDRERILEPIRALYRDFRNIGLPDLTEDALYESFAIGLYDSIEPSAPVSWVLDPRCDPDPVCEINGNRDDVVKGTIFPSGHARPLSLPGCRCLVMVADY